MVHTSLQSIARIVFLPISRCSRSASATARHEARTTLKNEGVLSANSALSGNSKILCLHFEPPPLSPRILRKGTNNGMKALILNPHGSSTSAWHAESKQCLQFYSEYIHSANELVVVARDTCCGRVCFSVLSPAGVHVHVIVIFYSL